jgi:hypothetical protein
MSEKQKPQDERHYRMSEHLNFDVFVLGQPYSPERAHETWAEHMDVWIGPQHTLIRLVWNNPSTAEIRTFNTAPVEFAWIEGEQAAFLSAQWTPPKGSRLPGIPWQEGSYSHQRQPEANQGLPGDWGTSILCHLMFLDARGGIIRGMRIVSWPADAADAIRRGIQRQLDRPVNDAAEAAYIQAMYEKYESTGAMVRDRADLIWRGGKLDARRGGGPAAARTLD